MSMQTQTELPAKIQSWIEQIESGKAKSGAAKILEYIKANQFSTIEEISTAMGIVKSTVTARMTSLLELGIIYRCGIRKINGRPYQLYGYVYNPANYCWFGQLYRTDKLIERLKGVKKEDISPMLASTIEAEVKRLQSNRTVVYKHIEFAHVQEHEQAHQGAA